LIKEKSPLKPRSGIPTMHQLQ